MSDAGPSPLVCCRLDPTPAALDELAALFERYLAHHGQPAAPDATRAWLGERAGSGELAFLGARRGERMVGFAAVHEVPASLALGRFWQLRDLFVDEAARRQGVARRLVEAARRAAAEAGALRLSLQTEAGNAAALALYRRCGFAAHADLVTLSLDVATTPGAAPGSPG